jgi:hypothetical protein
VWEALVQSQVRVLEKVPEKVPVWEASGQSQVRFNRVPEKVLGIFGAGPGQDRISSAWHRSTLQKDLEK